MAKMGRPKVDKPKNKYIGIRLPEEEYKRIKEYADGHNTTVTEMLYAGMYMYIKQTAGIS